MIHISGSLAFDRIMTFPGHFEEHILPEKLHFLNDSFPIDRLEEKLGGTAGNTLVIEHGGGVKSIFYNLRALQVDAGDTVGIGEQIATTNAVTIGEVRIGEVPVDPLPIWRGLCDAMRYY